MLSNKKGKLEIMKDKIIVKNGVKYHIMEIAGQQMEIRIANQSDVEAFKANKRSLYDK